MLHYIIGSVWFVTTGGWALHDQDKRKKEDGSFAPMTGLSLIAGTLFLGPYAVGVWYGLDTMSLASVFPPFAMYAFTQLIFG
jgi:hypothetical protein